MTEDLKQLASQLDDVVRSVPGVATVFAADPALVRSAKQLTAWAEPLPLVTVVPTDGGLSIVASVGVDGDQQAPLTAHTVSVAIRDALPPGVEADIHVRVSRVTRPLT